MLIFAPSAIDHVYRGMLRDVAAVERGRRFGLANDMLFKHPHYRPLGTGFRRSISVAAGYQRSIAKASGAGKSTPSIDGSM